MTSLKPKIIVVAGPTAVGKSEYAIKLAKKYDGEIVSLDSVQVYKYLDIGSAKIKDEEMQGIPHHMISVVEPNINLNVKEFKDMAGKCIEDILKRKKMPILVGGTGFYIRAVLYDTDFLYEDEVEATRIRNELYDELKEEGINKIYNELKIVDEKSAVIIPKENERRIIRALEFYKLHGFPISKHNEIEKNKDSKYDFEFYVLNIDRDKLYDRINRRVDKMIKDGLVKEVGMLIKKGYTKELNSMKSIGYSELYDYCNENMCDKKKLDEIIELIKQHSRNYAKRQLTWFRAQKNIKWVNVDE